MFKFGKLVFEEIILEMILLVVILFGPQDLKHEIVPSELLKCKNLWVMFLKVCTYNVMFLSTMYLVVICLSSF